MTQGTILRSYWIIFKMVNTNNCLIKNKVAAVEADLYVGSSSIWSLQIGGVPDTCFIVRAIWQWNEIVMMALTTFRINTKMAHHSFIALLFTVMLFASMDNIFGGSPFSCLVFLSPTYPLSPPSPLSSVIELQAHSVSKPNLWSTVINVLICLLKREYTHNRSSSRLGHLYVEQLDLFWGGGSGGYFSDRQVVPYWVW